MGELSSETLIYIQKLKTYFDKKPDAKEQIFFNVDDDTFYKHLGEIAEKNFKEFGDPILSEIQFEILRKAMYIISLTMSGTLPKVPLWMDLGELGKICSN